MFKRLLSWWQSSAATTPSADHPGASANGSLPIPEALWQTVVARLPFVAALEADALARLRQLSGEFLGSKEFSAASGMEIDDEICLTIAIQGCLPILELGLHWYDDWVGIIVYPAEFVIPREVADEFGVVHKYDDVASGEAWLGGPLIVSWEDVNQAGDGYNVVIHEFAHKLDMRGDGDANGLPPLPASAREGWQAAFDPAYERFCAAVDAADALHSPARQEAAYAALPFDPYAADSPGEFFAVLSETFFEQPWVFAEAEPALYRQFCAFYRQDPLTRLPQREARHGEASPAAGNP